MRRTTRAQTVARERAERMRNHVAAFWSEMKAAYAAGDWFQLNYEDWPTYLAGEFPARPQLTREDRSDVFADLASAGMSQREIAAATGVSQMTVSRSSSDSNDSDDDLDPGDDDDDDEEEPEVVDGEVIDVEDEWTEEERALQERMRAGETIVVSYRGNEHARVIAWADGHGHLVRVDRKSKWGNPFEIPDDGDRAEVIRKFEEYYLPHKPVLMREVKALQGLALACWCAPAACHGDVLARLADLGSDEP